MSIKQNYQTTEVFTEELFSNPPAMYRGAPFWAWNGKLDKRLLAEQIDHFQKMGFGGFHIHSRIGLSTEYLGEEFIDCVKFCHGYGAEQGMLTYLYDEDKWPSGYGGGRVTKEEAYRARYLLFTPYFHPDGSYDRGLEPSCRLTENGELRLLASYRVTLKNGRLAEYSGKIEGEGNRGEAGNGEAYWYAYLAVTDRLPWFNEEAYVDTLNPEAVQAFTRECHDRYYEALGSEFSRTVPSIFTDEPQFVKLQNLKDGNIPQEVGLPFTDDLEEEYRGRYGESLLERLPEIVWESADGGPATVRCRYLNLVADRFADSYAGTLGRWCEAHHIMLTGHVMEEASLEKQARCVGDAMRCYRYFQMAGIDMLADQHEYTTAKQAQSVARQMGKPGLASELYGVTNWDFDFRGHKLQGDWQAALGVTVRVPHLAWMYMGGESKRDYPAPIDAHSPWFDRYRIIEDYFSRVNTAMTRGRAEVKVCVLHPMESMFLLLGPDRDTRRRRQKLEEEFQLLARWLLFGQIDFDYLSEALAEELYRGAEDGRLCIGEMTYEAVVVPPLETIRSGTLKLLEEFRRKGGNILVLGELPRCVDGQASEAASVLEKNTRLGFDRHALLALLAPCRQLEITDGNGLPRTDLIYQLRAEADRKWLFIAHGETQCKEQFSIAPRESGEQCILIELAGCYHVTLWNAMEGHKQEVFYELCPGDGAAEGTPSGRTRISTECWEHDSILLELKPAEGTGDSVKGGRTRSEEKRCVWEQYVSAGNPYTLEEPNVLVWDMAEYALDNGEWQEREEILRIDDVARRAFGYRQRTDSFPQPWLSGEENPKEHTVTLRLCVDSQAAVEKAELALECDEDAELFWNGERIPVVTQGCYVDASIRRIALGKLRQGSNILVCRLPFGPMTNLEWMYLLGDFGVRLEGGRAVLTQKPGYLGFGDYAVQGFPFYGGNLSYEISAALPEGEVWIEIGEYAAPLVEAALDDNPPTPMFAAPYRIKLGHAREGVHTITLRSFGSRINTFGQLHNCNPREVYFGPKTWRTTGRDWCYEYRLHPCGILKAPVIRVYR